MQFLQSAQRQGGGTCQKPELFAAQHLENSTCLSAGGTVNETRTPDATLHDTSPQCGDARASDLAWPGLHWRARPACSAVGAASARSAPACDAASGTLRLPNSMGLGTGRAAGDSCGLNGAEVPDEDSSPQGCNVHDTRAVCCCRPMSGREFS
jgi:hypothetical protein